MKCSNFPKVITINLNTKQVVAALKETEQQLLDVEEVATTNKQKGVTGDNNDRDNDDEEDDFGDLSVWEYASQP